MDTTMDHLARGRTRTDAHRALTRTRAPHVLPEALHMLCDSILFLAEWRHYDVKSDEFLTECRMCGDWEGHTDTCPIPLIERLVKGPTP